ncbi:MAG: class I SAM-dependent methyltransferase [Planctomycetes bacterium]|nr:class I SAM-dependent methyltransferase [Planctomycetota bacterium]
MSFFTASDLESLKEDAHLVPANLRDWWLDYLKTHRAHYESVLSRLPAPKECGRLLEVGAMPGHLTILLTQRGYEVCSVDLDPTRLSDLWSHHAVDIRKVDIEKEPLPFADGRFSCVLFTEILEHLRVQPIFALQETARVLARSGQLILSLPNITPLDRLGFLFGRDYQGDIIAEFAKLERFGHMGHIRLYSTREVHRILEHVGYTNIEYRREGQLAGRRLWRILFPWRDAFRQHVYFVACGSGSSEAVGGFRAT